jgi:hypothetical protein
MKIMQTSIKGKRTIALALVIFALSSFALCQQVQSATDTPDPGGSLPVSNTADGQNALRSLTTGIYNSAFGFDSLLSLTDGSFCTAVGGATLILNTGSENTATGAGALLTNSTGSENTATGAFALFSNADGGANTADGAEALLNNTSGNDNTATGRQALLNNTTGGSNTAIGESALFNNIDGGVNTGIGVNVLQNNSHGHDNTAIGVNALGGNATGNFNIGLGSNAGVNVTSASNVICIGADGNNVDNACYIGQIFNATSSGGTAVFINSNGRLGTATSSRRFKEEIKPMDKASEALLALKPVTFRYKKEIDPTRTSQFGLVAEEVEKVNPDLVVRDKEGKPYSVRYEQVNAMLLNEFLKEHRKEEKLEAALEAVNARLKDQDSKLQKVSDEMKLSRPAPRIVLSNP